MRSIDIQQLSPGKDRVRRVAIAERPEGTLLAVSVGDEARTHTVHWLRLSDSAEIRRRNVPFSATPDPAFSPELSLLAYTEYGQDGERIILEKPDEPRRGPRAIPLPPDWHGREAPLPPRCFYLAINCDAEALVASVDSGALLTWNIRDAFTSDAPIEITQEIIEEFMPVRALAHHARSAPWAGPTAT